MGSGERPTQQEIHLTEYLSHRSYLPGRVNWGKKKTILNGSPQFPVQEVWRRGESPYFWGVPHGRGPGFGPVRPFFPQQDISSDPWASLHPCPVRGCLCTVAPGPHVRAPLLWTPSKPGEALAAQRSQGKNLEVTEQPLPRWMLQRQNVCL